MDDRSLDHLLGHIVNVCGQQRAVPRILEQDVVVHIGRPASLRIIRQPAESAGRTDFARPVAVTNLDRMRTRGQRMILIHNALTERHVPDHRAVDHQTHVIIEGEAPGPGHVALRTVPDVAGVDPCVVVPAPETTGVRAIGGLGTVAGARGELAADQFAGLCRVPVLHDDTLQKAGPPCVCVGNVDRQQRAVAGINDLAIIRRI